MAAHKDLQSIHKGAHVDSVDPGAVGAGKLWVDTTGVPPYQLKVRNAGDTAWETVGIVTAGGGGGGGGGQVNEATTAAGATFTSSSSGNGATANAFDNNDGTSWGTDTPAGGVDGVLNAWLRADLGSAKIITAFRALQTGVTAVDWKLQSSTDDAAWTDRNIMAAETDTGIIAITGGPITARYWRLFGTASAGLGFPWVIADFKIYSGTVAAAGGHIISSSEGPVDPQPILFFESGFQVNDDPGGTQTKIQLAQHISMLHLVIDGGGAVIPAGVGGDLMVYYNANIIGIFLMADQVGDVELDVWGVEFFTHYPPVIGDTLLGTGVAPELVAAAFAEATLTDWNVILNAGHVLRFNVVAATTVEKLTIAVALQRRLA